MNERRLVTSCPGLIIRHGAQDVTEDIVLTEGRSNPFGWSAYRLVHRERAAMAEIDTPIGWLESGSPGELADGYDAEDTR